MIITAADLILDYQLSCHTLKPASICVCVCVRVCMYEYKYIAFKAVHGLGLGLTHTQLDQME